jgi:hypothetical protein
MTQPTRPPLERRLPHELDELIRAVRRNCDISDALHAGVFSICGLALRLRDLFKWEKGLPPWQEGEPGEVLDWIGAREQHWDRLAGCDYEPLRLNGRSWEPFDTVGVNAVLSGRGLYYGAGYARGLKPTFFLAAVEGRREIEGCSVFTLGREVARDLLTLPALSQGRTILLRRESAHRFLWDQIAYAAPSARSALDAAMQACNITDGRPAGLRRDLSKLLAVQEAIHLHHELGEIHETEFGRELWQEIIAAFPLTRVELLARHVKDLLADTNAWGALRWVLRTRSAAGLALYVALADRLARALFPELAACLESVLRRGDWAAVSQAVEAGRGAAKRLAAEIAEIYSDAKRRNDLSGVEAGIERCLGGCLTPEN